MSEEAGPEDAGHIARLHVESWRATYTRELSARFLESLDVDARAAEWRRRLEDGVCVLLEREAGRLLGFVACGPERLEGGPGRGWQVFNLHVSPDRHGQGVGGRLFDAASRLGRARGAREVILWVVESNARARGFYEDRGMHWDGGRQDRVLGEQERLRELRYRMSLEAADGSTSAAV